VSWLGYAFRFMQLPLALFRVAIASATLPAISAARPRATWRSFRRTLSRSLGIVFLLTVPSSVGLAVLGQAMIGAIYEGGKFEGYDTRQTALALSCYAVGLAGYAAIKVLSPAFYALEDARTPMLVSLLSIGVNLAVVELLLRYTRLGHAGLALSTSAVALAGFLILFSVLRRRIGGIYGRSLAASTAKIVYASVAMGVAVVLLRDWIEVWLGVSRTARLVQLGLAIPLGAAVFYGSALHPGKRRTGARFDFAPLRRWLPAWRDRIRRLMSPDTSWLLSSESGHRAAELSERSRPSAACHWC
jgi:putative peptidoglycan lipid II flippase